MSPHSASERPQLVALDDAARAWLSEQAAAHVLEAEERPFDESEYRSRLARVRRRMGELGLEAMLVFRPSSVEYLCGYHSAERAPQPLLVTHTTTHLYVPDLELGRALASAYVGHVCYCGYATALQGLRLFLEHAVGVVPGGSPVGIEVDHPSTPPRAVQMLKTLQTGGIRAVPGEHLVENVRLHLSAAEIGCVEQAALHTQAGVEAAVAAAAAPGATDSSVAAAMAEALYRRADSASAWGPVVATGRRAGIAHSSWVHTPLAAGTTFLELAGAHHRYHAPVMRTLVRGVLEPRERQLADLARTTVTAVLEGARSGVECAEVARYATRAIGRLPEDVVFHGLFGYPVGLAHPPHWMDGAPFHITLDNHEPLREGMVFHVPASFRSFGHAGVGLSQTFVVTADGTRVVTRGRADLIDV